MTEATETQAAPTAIASGAFPPEMLARLRVVDAATGETIAGVIEADAEAGTVRRFEVEGGNIVRKGDSFAVVDEQRDIRIEWIEPTGEADA